jgi:hypothetical protein
MGWRVCVPVAGSFTHVHLHLFCDDKPHPPIKLCSLDFAFVWGSYIAWAATIVPVVYAFVSSPALSHGRPLHLGLFSFNNFNFEKPETEWPVNYCTKWITIAKTHDKQNEWKRVASNS